MKFKTKQKRCIAIVDAYCAKFQKSAVTMEEVSVWAIASGLYPIPKRGDSEQKCEEWERRLSALEAP